MQRWDGYDKDRRYKYSEDQIDFWDMTIDEKGTVYYVSHETVPKGVNTRNGIYSTLTINPDKSVSLQGSFIRNVSI